jgi:hypothetical protein
MSSVAAIGTSNCVALCCLQYKYVRPPDVFLLVILMFDFSCRPCWAPTWCSCAPQSTATRAQAAACHSNSYSSCGSKQQAAAKAASLALLQVLLLLLLLLELLLLVLEALLEAAPSGK